MKNLFSIFLFGIFFLGSAQVQANSIDQVNPVTSIGLEQQGNGIFIHISYKVLKRTPKGLICEIISFSESKRTNAKNMLSGYLRLKGNKVQLKLDDFEQQIGRMTMPKGMKLTKHISTELGASKQVVMSGGSTMVRMQNGHGILQFEIQM
ncbi:MAG: hypothetical protein AAF705_04690 [Bacteroidota bacterium]